MFAQIGAWPPTPFVEELQQWRDHARAIVGENRRKFTSVMDWGDLLTNI
jgi:hypothetical protein